MATLAERFPPTSPPWTPEYVEGHRGLVCAVLDSPELLQIFKTAQLLPSRYGVGFDERVVELPWLFAQSLGRRMLDAGSSLNQRHLIDRLLPRIDGLHVVTLAPEPDAFTDRGVSYLYEDLRNLPYRDGWFDAAACISTLEHVGMDNTVYGAAIAASPNPEREAAHALGELSRVLDPGGRLFLTVPYGAGEDHGWFRQYDREAVDALRAAPGLELEELTVFAYSHDGWQVSDLEAAASARYRDYHQDPTPVADLAAAARAVVCLRYARSR